MAPTLLHRNVLVRREVFCEMKRIQKVREVSCVWDGNNCLDVPDRFKDMCVSNVQSKLFFLDHTHQERVPKETAFTTLLHILKDDLMYIRVSLGARTRKIN
jgi:hypothetical protein